MWPWGHAIFGYLCYLLGRPRSIVAGDRYALLTAVFASQVPDLIDKPLAWGLAIIPSGRSLGHSLFTAVVICSVVYVIWRTRHREVGFGFAAGYVSHLVGDSLALLSAGEYDELGFLLWPVLAAPDYDEPVGLSEILAMLSSTELTPTFLLELGGATVIGCVLLVHFVWLSSWSPSWGDTSSDDE